MNKNDSLGDRMKTYENVTRTHLTRRTPVIIRIDGKAFHTFTRNFVKPFDDILVETMQDTMKYLCENIEGCVLGYTQSDEITLVLCDYKKLTSQAWFDNNIQKMCSISASMATLEFNRKFCENKDRWFMNTYNCVYSNEEMFEKWFKIMKTYNEAGFHGALFDSRAFNIPKEEVNNCLLWRQQDATRNSIQSVAQANFSHKQLQNKNCSELQEMLKFPQNNPHHMYDVLIHTLYTAVSCQNDLILRLAALFHDIGKPHSYQDEPDGIRHFVGHNIVGADMTDKIMRRLKYDSNTRNAVVQLILYHDSSFIAKPSAVKRWLNKVGEVQLKRLIDLRRADIRGQKIPYDREKMRKIDDLADVLNQVLEEQQCFSMKDLSINGDDLIALGFVPGKKLGEVLKSLLMSVIDNTLPNDRETLLKEAQKWLE